MNVKFLDINLITEITNSVFIRFIPKYNIYFNVTKHYMFSELSGM